MAMVGMSVDILVAAMNIRHGSYQQRSHANSGEQVATSVGAF